MEKDIMNAYLLDLSIVVPQYKKLAEVTHQSCSWVMDSIDIKKPETPQTKIYNLQCNLTTDTAMFPVFQNTNNSSGTY